MEEEKNVAVLPSQTAEEAEIRPCVKEKTDALREQSTEKTASPPEKSTLAPESSALAPEASAFAPESSAFPPESSALAPESSALAMENVETPLKNADVAEKETGSVFSQILKAVLLFLGLFAGIIYAVWILDGVSERWTEGLEKLALGEIYGGRGDIRVVAMDGDDGLAPEPKPDFPTEEPVETDALPSTERNGGVEIVAADLSAKAENGLTLVNETPYTPELTADSERAVPPLQSLYEEYGSDAPVVLILHTHATEAYAPDGAKYVSEEAYRSEIPTESVLAVGRTLAETLTEQGINVLFCEELFDAGDFSAAYYNASLKIREYKNEYPSISYIFDLHRDSIPQAGSQAGAQEGGERTLRPVTTIDGAACAQIMIVVGTDHGGSGHVGWTDNFQLACRLQSRIASVYDSLMRPINLRSASFNEQYAKGSLLFEMGAVGSSLKEACNSARILGKFLAEEIVGDAAS